MGIVAPPPTPLSNSQQEQHNHMSDKENSTKGFITNTDLIAFHYALQTDQSDTVIICTKQVSECFSSVGVRL